MVAQGTALRALLLAKGLRAPVNCRLPGRAGARGLTTTADADMAIVPRKSTKGKAITKPKGRAAKTPAARSALGKPMSPELLATAEFEAVEGYRLRTEEGHKAAG